MHYVLIGGNASNEIAHAGIKGMRWGVRRYQNEDGSLTEAGKKRYSDAKKSVMDKARNDAYVKAAKKHLVLHPGDTAGAKAAGREASKYATATTKIDENALRKKTLDEAVKSDLDNTQTVLRESSSASRTLSSAVKQTKVRVPRMDLSNMTDKEMRDRIQRERLESEYDSLFNSKRHAAERGKETVAGLLDTIGTVTTVAGSALSIALAIKALKGK